MQIGGKEAPVEPRKRVSPDPTLNRDIEFVYECRRTDEPGNPWQVSRYWRAGSSRINELRVNGVDLAPLQ